jgi:hypothetical protein
MGMENIWAWVSYESICGFPLMWKSVEKKKFSSSELFLVQDFMCVWWVELEKITQTP